MTRLIIQSLYIEDVEMRYKFILELLVLIVLALLSSCGKNNPLEKQNDNVMDETEKQVNDYESVLIAVYQAMTMRHLLLQTILKYNNLLLKNIVPMGVIIIFFTGVMDEKKYRIPG